jgi:hypothetical protein
MAGELHAAVVPLVARILGASIVETPLWLLRPAAAECGTSWETICRIHSDITGLTLPGAMPPRETRRVDAVLAIDGQRRILEVDETRHFNRYRALALCHYPEDARVAFPVEAWIAQSQKKSRLEGGAFGKLKPPLFPRRVRPPSAARLPRHTRRPRAPRARLCADAADRRLSK